jgi:DNA repair protein SbcC/Rad50
MVEPRFANTNLNSFLYYKKQHANVKVVLHGEKVIASHVASEAQITDLQFAFLLAMARTYQWSSWKALLLDNPTQHHDLVHASAVFDLLRDYIVDHNFQILLARHDSVQAKFFVRKLENDGDSN